MSNKAVHDHNPGQKSASDVGRLSDEPCIPSNEDHQHRQGEHPEKDTATVNSDAPDPFTEVIALGFEYEPFVSKK